MGRNNKRFAILGLSALLVLVGCDNPNPPDDGKEGGLDLGNIVNQVAKREFATKGTFLLSAEDCDTGEVKDTYVSDLETIYRSDLFYVKETSQADDSVSMIDVYKDEKTGNAVKKVLMPNNQVINVNYLDSEDNPYLFETRFNNPLTKITKDNLELSADETKVEIVDLSKTDMLTLAILLTGYSETPLLGLEFELDDGVIKKGTAVAQIPNQIGSDNSINNINITYTFDFVEESIVDFEEVKPFDKKSEDATLNSLFVELRKGNYTINETRTGGVAISEQKTKMYFNDEVVLKTLTNVETNKEVGGGYYYVEDEGLIDVSLEDDFLVGKGNLYDNTKECIDYVPTFVFDGAVFDYKDGVYTLKEGYGFENYIQYTAPDYAFNMSSYLYYLVKGTYQIKLTTNGATFEYDYAFNDQYGQVVKGHIKLEVSNIGTTLTPYTYIHEDDILFDSWDDFGEESLSAMKEFLGDNAQDVLPWIGYDKDVTYNGFVSSKYIGQLYGNFVAQYKDAESATSKFNEYRELLISEGWTQDADPEATPSMEAYRYTKPLEDGTGYYRVSVRRYSSNFVIQLMPKTTSLSDFLTTRFENNDNVTMDIVKNTKVYSYNSDTQEVGELTKEEDVKKQFKVSPNCVAKYTERKNEFFAMYNNKLVIVLPNSSGEGYNSPASYDDYTFKDYAMTNAILPSNLINSAETFEKVSETDNRYQPVSGTEETVAKNLIKLVDESPYYSTATYSADITIDFWMNTFEICITEEYTTSTSFFEVTYTLSYSRIGATTVSEYSQFDFETMLGS